MDNAIWSFFFSPPKEKMELIKLLDLLPVFDNLSQSELVQVERFLHERKYMNGEDVFKEGDPGAAMYIIRKGKIDITKDFGENNTVTLATLKDGEFFGELALLQSMPRSASAHAVGETWLLAFSKPDLEKIYDRNPRLSLKIVDNLAGLLCQRLIKNNENLEILQNRVKELEEKYESEPPQEKA